MVVCNRCGNSNPLGTEICPKCGSGAEETLVSSGTLQGTFSATLQTSARQSPIRPTDEAQTLMPGAVIADRYQVIDTLGVGGMGSVYKVFDRRLTRAVALKTIHPELAATPLMMKRFKQEVLLAQKITHKNVVRIFDIGEDQGLNFITMDLIEGVSLKDLIRERGAFPPVEAVAMIREICRALEAAHGEGVIHRDLKPQNIMIDKSQRVVVMDFGIARSSESSGATQTGALLGTPDYMSPEQARMEDVDARSDIFALGLIFYELLSGKLPFTGKTVVETLFIRTKERAIPPAEIQRNVPKGANDIVVKCLEPEPANRYQSVSEILQDLEAFDPTKRVGAGVLVKSRLKKHREWIALAALAVILAVGGFFLRNRFAPVPVAAHDNVTVVIADFANHTGDTLFDNALEPVVKSGLEQATFISAFDHRQAVSLDPKLGGKLDETAAQKIAFGQGIGFIVSGALDEQDSKYVVSIKATEAVTGKTLFSDEETAANKDEVLYAAGKLAVAVRVALGDDTNKRFANDTLSAISLAAVREYAKAMDALADAKHDVALNFFSSAAELDNNFGLAYAGMAVTSRNLHDYQKADQYMKEALQRIDSMTEREQMRTRAYYFRLSGDWYKCVDEYGKLIEKYPADVAAHNNLGICLTYVRRMADAIAEAGKARDILPKRPLYLNNLALYESYATQFKTAEDHAHEVQVLDAKYATGFVSLAFAQLGQGEPELARKTYESLVGIKPTVGKAGLADVALYEGRYKDAAQILEEASAADLTAGSKGRDLAAIKLAGLAYTRLMQGQKTQAASTAERALENSQTIAIRFLAGMVFAQGGKQPRAQAMIKSLASEPQPEPQAYAKIIEGELALQSRRAPEAIQLFGAANTLLNTWIGHFELGKAYLEAQQWVQADSEFSECLKRRGEAMALFLDENPTYGHFPLVFYYRGRAREGMKTGAFADDLKAYLKIREKAGEDLFIADAQKRVK